MKRLAVFTAGCGLALSVLAADEIPPGAAAVRDLGRVNGYALACDQKDMAAWIRVLMLTHAPKTRTYGEVFEEGTQETFKSQNRAEKCPDSRVLTSRLDEVTERLRRTFPSQAAGEAKPAAK